MPLAPEIAHIHNRNILGFGRQPLLRLGAKTLAPAVIKMIAFKN
jgi:hypothetical protein